MAIHSSQNDSTHEANTPEGIPKLTESDRRCARSLVRARHTRNDYNFRRAFVDATLGFGQLERVVWLLADELAALTEPTIRKPVDVNLIIDEIGSRHLDLFDPVRVPRDLPENNS